MTIYALSSGPGISGIAVIRISGEETSKAIELLTGKSVPAPRVATLRKINKINTSELIDEGIILWFPGPESYTGEDMAEFQVHGSKAVIEALHSSISLVENCRLAEPGEFTKIAFHNGKIDLLKAESIADLISSETEIQMRQALNIMKGNSASRFNDLREKLLKVLSYMEAQIDFPDDELSIDILKNVKKISKEVSDNIEKILSDQKVGQIIREGFKVAILGPTNAGKSTLINYLSNRDVAIVSETAGTTRDVIETHLNLEGYPVVVSDTAGIRDSENEIEKRGVKLALSRASEADLKLIVVDAESLKISSLLRDLMAKNAILVINKSDLLKKDVALKIKEKNYVLISLKNKVNLDELILRIKKELKKKMIMSDDIIITRERHRQHLIKCQAYLSDFRKKNNNGEIDKAAEDLRLATRHLGSIVGKVDVEEILGNIFKDFCIGK